MSSISQKLKEKFGIDIEAANLINRIREIEKWKDNYATPKISENIANIKSLLSDLNTVVGNINTNLLPRIQSAQANAEEAVKRVDVAVNNAKVELKDYTDSTVNAAKTGFASYIDSEMAKTKTTLTQYVDQSLLTIENKLNTSLNATKAEFKNYADGKVATVQTTLTSYINGEIATTKSTLKNYADTITRDAKSSLKSYTDNIASQLKVVSDRALAQAQIAKTQAQSAINTARTALAEIPVAVEAGKISIKAWVDNNIMPPLNALDAKIKNEIIPMINANIDKIKAFPAELEAMTRQVIADVQTTIKDYVDTNIMPSLNAVRDRFLAIGNGLKADILVLINQGNNMIITIKNELLNIKTTLISFGANIKTGAENIATGAKKIGDELVQTAQEIAIPLAESARWAANIGTTARKLDWLGMGISTLNAFGYMVLTDRSGQKGVVPTMKAGFIDISVAFVGLKNDFVAFGGILKNESVNIGNQMVVSGSNIKNSTSAFFLGFKSVFTNLSTRVQGGKPTPTKLISWTKLPALGMLPPPAGAPAISPTGAIITQPPPSGLPTHKPIIDPTTGHNIYIVQNGSIGAANRYTGRLIPPDPTTGFPIGLVIDPNTRTPVGTAKIMNVLHLV